MSDAYEHPRGDLEPPFRTTLYQPAAALDVGAVSFDGGRTWVKPVDLTTAERVWLVWRRATVKGPPVLRREATFDGARTTGKLSMIWQVADVPAIESGVYVLQAEIRWTGDRPQTVPSRGVGMRFVCTPDAG